MPRLIGFRKTYDDAGTSDTSAGERIFVYAWIGIVVLGFLGYNAGFSASLALCVAMLIFGIAWVAAFFAVIDVPIRRIANLSSRQYLFLACILASTAPASGYSFGWVYTENFGSVSQPILRVADKKIRYSKTLRGYTIRLAVDEIVPTYHQIDKRLWDRLEVGSSVQVFKSTSIWGTTINHINATN